jgi:hypothetical protein
VAAQPPGTDQASEATEEAHEPSPGFLKALELPDPAMLAVAKSLLEEAGVRFFIQNESTQNLLAVRGESGHESVLT